MLIKRCKNLPPAAPASTSRCANVCIVVVKVVKRMHNVQLTDMLFSSRGASLTASERGPASGPHGDRVKSHARRRLFPYGQAAVMATKPRSWAQPFRSARRQNSF